MTYRPTPLVHVAWMQPPRCLADYTAEPLREVPAFTAVQDEQAMFRVACSCGSEFMRIVGHSSPAFPGYLLSPLSTQCEVCRKIAVLFDPLRDGYDAELGYCFTASRIGEAAQFHCPTCADETFALYPTFSYQLEDDDLDAGQLTHAQDFFDWFVLGARCRRCDAFSEAAEYECA